MVLDRVIVMTLEISSDGEVEGVLVVSEDDQTVVRLQHRV